MKKYVFVSVLATLLLFGCNQYSDDINTALELAGNNRPEIEKVLAHYKTIGGEKYEAACFLIRNMKYHQSSSSIIIDPAYSHFFMQTDSLYDTIFGNMTTKEILAFKSKDYDSLRIKLATAYSKLLPVTKKIDNLTDLRSIKADFLIANIEEAFAAWKNNPLLKNMDFDTFKEFILPYRTTDEEILFSKTEIKKMYQKHLSKDGFSTIIYPLERYKTYVQKCRWLNYYIKTSNHIGLYDLFLPKFKMDCHNMTNWSINILRSCGIPAVYEYTPQWKDRDRQHFWCASPDSNGILKPYTAPENNLLEDWKSDLQYASKVYRKGFAANKNTPYFIANDEEFVPEELSSPLISDQTFRYHQTVTLRYPFTGNTSNKLAYLCLFNSQEIIKAVAWGIIDKSKKEIVFEQVPINTLFFPAIAVNSELKCISNPFMIKSTGNIDYIPQPLSCNENKCICDLILKNRKLYFKNEPSKSPQNMQYFPVECDTKTKINLHVLCKYPEKRRMKEMRIKLKNALFLGSNEEEGNYDTLFTLHDVPKPYFQEIKLNNKKKYRFYQFKTEDKGPVNIADMEFMGKSSKLHKCVAPTPLPIFSSNDREKENSNLYKIIGIPLKTGKEPINPFDGDFNTYAGASHIGMDFTIPVEITSVRFIPRNANNRIVPGDKYVLLYYNQKWIEQDTIVAKYNYIDFQNVPTNTVYWLKDLDSGNEELPFFYMNGKQYFVHIDDFPALK